MVKVIKKNKVVRCLRLLLLLVGAMTGSCAGDKYYLSIDDLTTPSDTVEAVHLCIGATVVPRIYGNDTVHSKVDFIYTNDTVPFPAGRYVHLFVYAANTTPQSGSPINFGIYEAKTDGSLSAIAAQYDFTLAPGIYNFYAIGEYTSPSDKTPPFMYSDDSEGLMYNLSNGLDYLWWSQENVQITKASPSLVSMVFSHISTMIQLNMYAAPGHTVDTIYQCTISGPSTSSSYLQLADGSINQAITMSGSFTLSNEGNSYYIDFVPFMPADDDLNAYINVQLDGGYSQWLEFDVPVPFFGFEQGNAYIYNVYLGEEEDDDDDDVAKHVRIELVKNTTGTHP